MAALQPSEGQIVLGSAEQSFEEHEAAELARERGTTAVSAAADAPAVDDPAPASADPVPAAAPAEPDAPQKDEKGRFTKRAKSKAAGPEDVPRIRELSAERHQERIRAEAAEARIAALEAELAKVRPASPVTSSPVSSPAPASAGGAVPAGFTEKEPTLDDIAAQGRTYEDWVKEWNRWDRHREQFETNQKSAAEQQTKDSQQALERRQSEYRGRAQAFAKQHPDFDDVVASATNVMLPPLVQAAVLTDDNGPAFVYHLAQRPDLLAEVLLLTDDRPLSDQAVAHVRRLLTARLAGGSTGAPQAPSVKRGFPPPTPVRTGPQQPQAQGPSESESFEAHEARENAKAIARGKRPWQ